MIEMMLDKYILYVLMGCVAVLGIVSKGTVGITLKRLVRAAGNMSKSTHPFMRLVRAKFEHACMVSDRVENVEVFVDKYLYEYKVAGIRLHTLRRMEMASAAACLALGAVGVLFEYMAHGTQDKMFQMGGVGLGLAVLVYAVHLITDEKYRLEAIKNYMVDYLENICLRRYEKNYRQDMHAAVPEVPMPDFGEANADRVVEMEEKEENAAGTEQEPMRPRPGKEVPSPTTPPELEPPVMPQPYEAPDVKTPVRAAKAEKEDKNAPKDVLIRQILEEFMA